MRPARRKPRAVPARLPLRIPAVVAALGIVPLLAIVLKRAVDVPLWDEWEWAELVYAAHQHTLTLGRLWQPHNEHRILVPNLLMLALDALGGWTPVREQLLSLVMLALTQLAVWRIVRRTVPTALRGIAFLGATVLLLGLAQFENLSWGFQMAWFLCNLGVVTVVLLLTGPRVSTRDVLLAAAVALAASVSSSQGLVAWPVGLVALVLVPRRAVARAGFWVVLGALTVAIVRAGAPHGDAAGAAQLAHPGGIIRYALVYLGTPLTLGLGATIALAAGAVLVVWLGALAGLALRAGLRLRVRLAPWLALAAYPLLAVVPTALARAGFGVEQAGSSRYTSVATLGWIAALVATCVVASRAVRSRPLGGALAAIAVAVLLLGSLRASVAGNRVWQVHAAQYRTVRAGIAAGDPGILPMVFPDPTFATDRLGEMARVHDGLFRP